MEYFFSKIKVEISKSITNILSKPTPFVYLGKGKIENINEILEMNNAKKVFIIASNTVTKNGLIDKMLLNIEKSGIKYSVYNGVKSDPTFDIVSEAQKLCSNSDIVVAIGGGSVLDTAKAVCAAVANNISAYKLSGLLKVKKLPLPLILVPTTAGTGSETTVVSVISDTKTHKKNQIIDPKIVPMCTVLDPELTYSLPPSITVQTTMDALTHALEAYVSTYATTETDRYAEISIKLIYKNLPIVMNNPYNEKGRENLLIASFYAGMAFTRTYVGYVHAFSHAIGGKFGVPHGLANAVILPYVMEKYIDVCEDRFARLADIVLLCSDNVNKKQKTKCFLNSIFHMNSKFEIPKRLDKFPKTAVNDIVSLAFKECHGTYPVPLYFSRNEATELLYKICSKK